MPKKKVFDLPDSLKKALIETVNIAHENSSTLNMDIIPLEKIKLDSDNPREMLLTPSDIIHGINKNDR